MNKKIFMTLTIISILVMIANSALTLQQYPEYELQTPAVIFDQIQQSNIINHPEISNLVFITPWNHEGKRLTVKYANKLKYVSPCWYQLILKNQQLQWENDQLIDREYLKEIKNANPAVKVLPRIYINKFEVFNAIGSSQTHFKKALSLIVEMIKNNGFDGIVWDSPYDLFVNNKQSDPLNRFIQQFVNVLNQGFKAANKDKKWLIFFNMANPSNKNLDESLYRDLSVDGLLIQNYDSPLDYIKLLQYSVAWVQKVKPQIKQVIMMLPFFSYKNGQGMSTGQAMTQLKQTGIFSSGFERGMCKFLSNKKFKYNVPCFKYFNEAFKILKKSGCSAGFWQGGNGLENYYLFL